MSTVLTARSITAIFLALSLAACGGSSGDDGNDNKPPTPTEPDPTPNPNPDPEPNPDPDPVEVTIGGAIVVPDGAQVDSAARTRAKLALARPLAVAAANSTCPDVPTGYAPVANAAISFTTADDQVSGVTTQTDECGVFSATVPANIAYVTATATGYKVMTVPASTFDPSADNTPPALSILPDVADAGYEIASLQWTDSKLYFTIVDTITNKAVLGVPQTAVSYSVNGANPDDLKSLAYAASQVDGNASIALALDASSSMSSTVRDNDGNVVMDENGRSLNALRMTARAAHTFLDGKRVTDEVGFVIFDTKVSWIDRAFLEERPMVSGPEDAPVDYKISYDDSGFNTSADDLRLTVDQYNYYSAFWGTGNSVLDQLHTTLPATLRFNLWTFYPWYGATAAYSAADVGREKVLARNNARKIVVLMSDGDDNSSRLSADELIANFKQDSIPLWTVAFGTGVSEDVLKRIADETGGHYISSVDQSQLQAEFAAMQTGIVFQYIAELQQSTLPANTTLKVDLNFGSLSASRSLVLQ